VKFAADYAFEKEGGDEGADADGDVGDAEANVDEGATTTKAPKMTRKASDVFAGKKRTFGSGKANMEKSSSGGVKRRN